VPRPLAGPLPCREPSRAFQRGEGMLRPVPRIPPPVAIRLEVLEGEPGPGGDVPSRPAPCRRAPSPRHEDFTLRLDEEDQGDVKRIMAGPSRLPAAAVPLL